MWTASVFIHLFHYFIADRSMYTSKRSTLTLSYTRSISRKPYKVVCLPKQHEVDVEYPMSVFHSLSFSTQIPLLKSTVVIIRCVLIRVWLAVTVGFQEKPDPAERGSVEAKTSCCRTAPLIRCLSAWQSDPNPSPVPQLQLHSVCAPLLHCLIGAVTFGAS